MKEQIHVVIRELEIDGYWIDEVDAEIGVHFTAGTPDVYYLPNGDPGYPGDPPECHFDGHILNLDEIHATLRGGGLWSHVLRTFGLAPRVPTKKRLAAVLATVLDEPDDDLYDQMLEAAAESCLAAEDAYWDAMIDERREDP